MPLILLCGYPCSGKTTITKLLVEAISKCRPDSKVIVISEEEIARRQSDPCNEQCSDAVNPRNSIYASASSEKQFRSQLKAETERALTGNKSGELLVLVDANNYIKGYRYEMHCLAKSVRHQQAILHCTTLLDTCRDINNKLGRYSEALFSDIVSRFEPPNPSSRWDSPLYRVSLLYDQDPRFVTEQDLSALINDTASSIIKDLLCSGSKVRPNQSTVPIQSASANYLQKMDQATSEIINSILNAQKSGSESFSMPSDPSVELPLTQLEWTVVTLNKAKRRFLAFIRSNSHTESSDKYTNEADGKALFLRFLNSETHHSAFLT